VTDSETHPPDSVKHVANVRAGNQRISIPAVIGVMLFVAGAIAFGIWGPRMEQRIQIVTGQPLQDLVDVVIKDHVIALHEGGLRAEEPIHPEEARSIISHHMGTEAFLPDLRAQGWTLLNAENASNSEEEMAAVRLMYQGPEGRPQQRLMVHLVSSPENWVHFDSLGRQVPLTPLTHIDEAIELGGGNELGISIVCFPTYAVIVTSLDSRDASEAANAILSPGGGDKDSDEPKNGFEEGLERDSVVFSGDWYSKRRFQRARMNQVFNDRMCPWPQQRV
jgi:hypothetical protein